MGAHASHEALQAFRRGGSFTLISSRMRGPFPSSTGTSDSRLDEAAAEGAPSPSEAEAEASRLIGGAGAAARNDLYAGARWVEEALPFSLLLAFVYIQNHLASIFELGWLVFMLGAANERMRWLTALKEHHREPRKLLLLGALLSSQIALITLLEGGAVLQQLALRTELPSSLALTEVLWLVLLTDLLCRYALMLLKTLLALALPLSTRRLRRLFSLVEEGGSCYRSVLPVPVWHAWLVHAAERHMRGPISLIYLTFKLSVLVERLRATAAMAHAVLLHQVLVGRHASEAEMLELGEELCSICQEPMSCPISLDECGHVFCEQCILSWCERSSAPTCPLCRTPLAAAACINSDGTTSLLPQLF
ncbi:hypothetical protein AB1Y20_002642 [Prymnesium parvum]|uniref:RING-type domain-containing protein n=1 Tax=Prymnesium parvum TaxID=97485 RepID=A0AB34J9M7_PRYPA